MCHKPGTPAEQTIRVPLSAVPGHLGHGDYFGPCTSSIDDTTSAPEIEIEPTPDIISQADSITEPIIDSASEPEIITEPGEPEIVEPASTEPVIDPASTEPMVE